MSAIDNAKKHFAEQDVKVIEVPEWGEDDKALKIYSKPLTLAETSKLYKMSKEDDLTMMAYVLIYKALDENGDKLEHSEEITMDVDGEHASKVIDSMKRRKGKLIDVKETGKERKRLICHARTRG